MNTDNLHILLNRFYEGETNEEEEKLLRGFFEEESAETSADDIYFRFLKEERNNSLPDISDDEIIEKINAGNNKGAKVFKYWLGPLAGIAAAVVIYFSFLVPAGRIVSNDENVIPNTVANPHEAYVETEKALLLVSDKLNMGLAKMDELSMFDKEIDKLHGLSKLGKYSNKIINFSERINDVITEN